MHTPFPGMEIAGSYRAGIARAPKAGEASILPTFLGTPSACGTSSDMLQSLRLQRRTLLCLCNLLLLSLLLCVDVSDAAKNKRKRKGRNPARVQRYFWCVAAIAFRSRCLPCLVSVSFGAAMQLFRVAWRTTETDGSARVRPARR